MASSTRFLAPSLVMRLVRWLLRVLWLLWTELIGVAFGSITLLPALIGFAHGRLETTRWRGLLTAAFAALALLGAGLGSGPVALAGVGLAVGTLAASTVLPIMRRAPGRSAPESGPGVSRGRDRGRRRSASC